MKKVDKKLSITNIREMSEHYAVTIEIKFGDNFRAIVENDDESHIIKNGFDANLVDEIEKKCKEMKARRNKKMEGITKRLNNLSSTAFPDNLFGNGKSK